MIGSTTRDLKNLRLKVEELSFAFLKILVEFSLSFYFLDYVMNE